MKTLGITWKRSLIVPVLAIMLAGLQGCATTSHNSMPKPEKLVELGIVEADANLEQLKRGRVAAIMDCRGCHRQYWPQEFEAKRWPRLSEQMGKLTAMDDDEIEDLKAYFIAASKTVEQ